MTHRTSSMGSMLILFFLLTIPPASADFEEGLAAYDRKDYATALQEWQPLAEQGDADAQYNLGVMYEHGRGVLKKDDKQAVVWYRKAAEQGVAQAQYNLGVLYEQGRGGLHRDIAKAKEWYHQAADQGDEDAKKALARLPKGL